ncbi:hypothetical protein SLE2022_263130 [Rubroshorea leprosula]
MLRERLDWSLLNLSAIEEFLEARLINLPRLGSDHHAIMLCKDIPSRRSREVKPTRCEAAWLTHENFKTMFSCAWIAHDHSLHMAISSVRSACMNWSKSEFGDLFRRKRLLKARLTGIQNSPYYTYLQFLQDLETELLDEYHRVLHAEELFWCQKSHVEWITSRDKNTKFYHASIVIRRERNRITALQIEGMWVINPITLKEHV